MPPGAPRRRLLLAALIAAALVAAYALAGFLLLPWIAQRELPRYVEQNLHQRASIGAVSFNPFTLRLHAREFSLTTAAGGPLLSFGDAVADLGWRSLLRRAWVLDKVSLTDPVAHVEIGKDGRLNLAALAIGAGGTAAAQPPRLAVAHLSVANGSIDFADQRQAYRERLEHLSIELKALTTLDDEPGSYALQGQTPRGAKLSWKGSVALAPLVADGTLVLENLALAELMPYIDDYSPVRVLAGDADLELPYVLTLPQDKPRFIVKGAKLELRGLALAAGGESALQAKFGAIAAAGINFDASARHIALKNARIGPSRLVSGKDALPPVQTGAIALDGLEFALDTQRGSVRGLTLASAGVGAVDDAKSMLALEQLALEQLALEGIAFDLGRRQVSATILRVADLKLALERDAKGEIDLLRRFAADGPAGADAPGAWQASVGAVEIAGASARYIDRTAKTPLALAVDGLNGSFSVDAAAGKQGVRVRIEAPSIAMARLEAAAASAPTGGGKSPALRLEQSSLTGMRYDSGGKTLTAEAARIGSLQLDTALENGSASVLDLLPTQLGPKPEKPLSATVKLLELAEGSVSATDRASGMALELQRLSAKLKNVSSDSAQKLSFDAGAELKSGGHIALNGQAVPALGKLTAKIKASGVALAPIQPLLHRFASVKLGSGTASLAGTLRAGGKEAKLAYSGNAAVDNLVLDDQSGVRLFGWKSLATDALKASLSPDRVDIDELRLTAPAGRLAIAKDGSSNLSRAFDKAGSANDKPPSANAQGAPRAAQADAASAPAGQSAVAVAVRRVRVAQGALDFSDDSLSPGFVAKIVDLAGTANGLSSEREARSQFAFEGRVDEFGYARLSGTVNPFAPRDRSNFRVQLRNIDLATVSPYSMRFAGYRIASGRMAVDLNYRLRDSLLEGDNKIKLEKFTLGERVDSPGALKLPFELAVALLKDADGTISLEVPVKGNLDDPQFSLAPLVWKAVGNLIGNIVAAPFRALAQLFGGKAADFGGTILFDPGSSRVLPPEQEKLAHIAAALAKRPELKLEIPPHYDSAADTQALKRSALGLEIGRRAGFALAGDEAPGRINIEDDKTRAALRSLFAERFGKPELERMRTQAEAKARVAKQPGPPLAERIRDLASGATQIVDAREFYRSLLRRLRDAQALPPNALAELGRQRALAIETEMQEAGAAPARLVRIEAAPSADADAKQVNVQLRLAAR